MWCSRPQRDESGKCAHIYDVAILKAGKHLGHFHACGTDRGVPGGDSLDWKPIVAALKKIGYNQDVAIESFTTDVKVIARAAAIWRKMELSAWKGADRRRSLLGGFVIIN